MSQQIQSVIGIKQFLIGKVLLQNFTAGKTDREGELSGAILPEVRPKIGTGMTKVGSGMTDCRPFQTTRGKAVRDLVYL